MKKHPIFILNRLQHHEIQYYDCYSAESMIYLKNECSYGIFENTHLIMVMKILLLSSFVALSYISAAQNSHDENIPEHILRQPLYLETVTTPAFIDTSIFYRYLDFQLQNDSLPDSYRSGKPFSMIIYYIVSKEGRITEVRNFKGEDEELFQYIRQKLLRFPHTWTPATQNGRNVTAFLKLRLVKNETY